MSNDATLAVSWRSGPSASGCSSRTPRAD